MGITQKSLHSNVNKKIDPNIATPKVDPIFLKVFKIPIALPLLVSHIAFKE